ncbi:MAG: heme ABC transporter ATP-binding protein [Panacagrimonas sp.]
MNLRARGLGYFQDGRALVQGIDLELAPGEVLSVLGPNGAGKSTLLRLLSGELTPGTGQVELENRELHQWNPGDLARHRAVLPQTESLRFSFSVEQVVRLGRLPWPAAGRESEIVAAALAAAGVRHLGPRAYPELSAGERARVQFARVLAQVWERVDDRARYLLLDEPTASLDLAHQHQVLTTTRQFAASGVGVIAVMHDPNLALLYSDRTLLLAAGRVVASGPTREVLTAERVSRVFGIEVEAIDRAGFDTPWLAPAVASLRLRR